MAIPTGPLAPNRAIAVPRRRRESASRMAARITPVLPSWKPTSRKHIGQLPGLVAEGDAGKHDRLDQGTPDDHHLAAVLVRPHAPQRHERRTDDEDQCAEDPHETEPVGVGYAHRAQVGRREGEDLADAQALDERP